MGSFIMFIHKGDHESTDIYLTWTLYVLFESHQIFIPLIFISRKGAKDWREMSRKSATPPRCLQRSTLSMSGHKVTRRVRGGLAWPGTQSGHPGAMHCSPKKNENSQNGPKMDQTSEWTTSRVSRKYALLENRSRYSVCIQKGIEIGCSMDCYTL